VYVADLAAATEKQGILEPARVATSHWEELCEELWGEGHVADEPPNGSSEVDDDDFVHLDDGNLDDDFLAELASDHEAKLRITCTKPSLGTRSGP
jgi:hypothetical protein